MKHIVLALSLAALTACGGGGGSEAPKPCSIELNGDSVFDTPLITRRPGDYIREKRPHWQVNDLSVQGTTLKALMEGRPSRYVEKYRIFDKGTMPFATLHRTADVVVVENGAVDGLFVEEDGRYESRIRDMIALLQRENRQIVLTGMIPLPVGDYFTADRLEELKRKDAVSLRVASEFNIPHAGWGQMPFRGVEETTDGMHRDQESTDEKVSAPLLQALDAACARRN